MAMNYLEKKRQEEQARPAGLQGVSENTRNQQARYEGGYTPSQQTTTAQQNLAAVQQNRPQTYNSKYGAALDGILAKIQGGQDFNYSFDGDEMFKYYADLYTQNAKQGAANAMGQAVGLTGGYGNSWASAQANQAYQQALLPLYERGLDLRDRAYQMHQDKENKLMTQAGLLMDMDSADYGRYRDTMQDYYADVDRAQAAADNERAFDYNQYVNMLDYWNGKAAAENADFRADQDEAYRQQTFDESVRQANLDEAYRQQTFQQSVEEFNRTNALDWAQLEEKQREYDASLSEDQRQYNQKIAIAYVTDILANGQMPSNDLLVAAGLSLEDAQKLMAQIQVGGGGGPSKQPDTSADNVKPMSFLEANQYIFRNTPDNIALGDIPGYTGANGDKTFGEYKAMIENAVAQRDAQNTPTTEDKIKNASWTGAAGALTAQQAAAKEQPSKIDFNEWLKKQGAKK